ncbi:MAG: GNAT family N-acetyltransferase [Bacteroidetes bacterium]|nr:GNAT family N-acetyltransferase [Bacteroidota bacterium]
MLEIREYHSLKEMENDFSLETLINFLHTHLDRFGDSKEAIKKCVNYAFSGKEGNGGFVAGGFIEKELVGAVVMNETGMGGYIPENILVYIAVNSNFRNQGIGGKLVKHVVEKSSGDVKLHVEYDNPAKKLYERLGFTNKYAEMRFIKEKK